MGGLMGRYLNIVRAFNGMIPDGNYIFLSVETIAILSEKEEREE